jgi:cytochrome c-type biogenesis protein
MTLAKWLSKSFDKRNLTKRLLPALLFAGTILLILVISWIDWSKLFQPLQHFVLQLESSYHQWLGQNRYNNSSLLLLLAFVGGLIASISPCKLALLSVNLSYIGTLDITSRKDAFVKAGSFVLGVVTVLSCLGLFSSLIGAMLFSYRGYVELAVGLVLLVMGLNLFGLFNLPLPKINWQLPSSLGAYSVGLTFALVSSPCSSPVLFAVLTAAAATGSGLQSTLTMVSYALGNTAVIFLASLFAGLAKQTRILLQYSDRILALAGGLLILTGGYYLVNGMRWVVLSMSI